MKRMDRLFAIGVLFPIPCKRWQSTGAFRKVVIADTKRG